MREIYETAEDLAREADVATSLATCWQCSLQKLPKLYGVDFAALRNKEIAAWLEIKCRNKSYSTYQISLHKWMRGIELSEITGKPAFIVVSWPVNGFQEVIYRVINRDPIKVVIGGRKDRNDPADTEPMVDIPLNEFKQLFAKQEVTHETNDKSSQKSS